MHHAKYFTYFEIGRTELFRAGGGNYRKLEEDGTFAVVVEAQCTYRKPARYDDLLLIKTTLAEMGEVKFRYDYDMLRGSENLANANVTLALIDRNGNVQKIPEWMHEML